MLRLLVLVLVGQLSAAAVVDNAELEGRQYQAMTYPPVNAMRTTTAGYVTSPPTVAGRASPLAYALTILIPLTDVLSDGLKRFSPDQLTAAGLSVQDIQTITQIRDRQLSDFIFEIQQLRESINSFNSAFFCPSFHDFDLTTVDAWLTLFHSLATVVISVHTDVVNTLPSGDPKTLLTTILSAEIQQLNQLSSLQGKTPTANPPVIPLGLRTVASIIRNYYDDGCFITGVQIAERLPLLVTNPSGPGTRTQLPAGSVVAPDYLNPSPADQCVFLMSSNSASGAFSFRKQAVPVINKTCTVPADATGYVSIVIARVANGNDQTDANSTAAGPVVSIA
ncbi:hypothetical protein RvY_03692 [Ramazzottius varieornatus]|uniref:Uncharacterized protein n=1 Tax=Ramazzottius varieornatus TaxID=947166 RepID=A0A1D1UPR9_RAMVA|nr:hypothetical protein RvY_03692 [Ramazzottius varieornatus]